MRQGESATSSIGRMDLHGQRIVCELNGPRKCALLKEDFCIHLPHKGDEVSSRGATFTLRLFFDPAVF